MKVAFLSLALVALAGQASAESAKKYSVELGGTTSELKAGASGTLGVQLKPREGYKISAEAPLKIKLSSPGLALDKTQLGRGDAKDKGSISPAFAVKFGAKSAGTQNIDVDATFFVCDEKICERQQEKLSVPISVQP